MPDTPTADAATLGHPPRDRRAGAARLLGLDVARALAIIGMVAVNVGPTTGDGGATAWLYRLPHGRASVLFVLLAGIGFSLMTRRVRRRETGRRAMWSALAWRCLVLLVAGLALQLLPHDSNVILAVYAVLFVVAGLLVTVGDRVLLALAGLSLLGGPVLWLGLQIGEDEPFSGRAPALSDPPLDMVTSVLLTGPYPLVTWLAPFLLGIWLGRRDLSSSAVRRPMAVAAGAVAIGTWVVGAVSATARGGTVGDLSWELLLTDAPHGQMPLWLLGATASAMLVLVACLAGEQWLRDRSHVTLLRVPAAAGQLSLTIYVAHLVALALMRPLPHTLAQGVGITAAMCVVGMAGAAVWRSRFSRGPLELLARPPRTWRRRG